mgnify:CR=1 FL=1|tara:strand:- start:3221 stop:3643 length:423 start_codon:yes stop_codon:yes gene_type:complete
MTTDAEIEKDIQSIIDYSHEFAEKMLREYKEYYPFGVSVNSNGEIVPIGYRDNETDMPKSQKVIDELTNHFQDDLKNNKIRAYGITYDVRVQVNGSGEISDAILIDIVHRDSMDLPKYYFSYSWSEKDKLVFGNSFGMKR